MMNKRWIIFTAAINVAAAAYCRDDNVRAVSSDSALVEAYTRAYQLPQRFSWKKVTHVAKDIHWDDSTATLTYACANGDSEEYFRVNAETREKTPAVFETGRAQDGDSPAKKRYGEHPRDNFWTVTDDEREGEAVFSPDGKKVAFIYGCNLKVVDTENDRTLLETTDASAGNYYSAYIHWSPDSKKIAVCKVRPAPRHYIYYVESTPPDQFQPKLHKQEYQKPGDELPYKTPVIFDLSAADIKGKQADTDLFPNEYELTELRWNPSSEEITFEYNERGHKIYRLLAMSVKDGKVRTLVEEKEPKYVNYTRIWRHHFEDGERLLWTSERDGYNHLYLYDKRSGKLIRQITKGPWYVRDVQRVDEENGIIYFSANGMDSGHDPYLIHYYKIGIDGKNLVDLTPETAFHQAQYSKDGRYLVDTYSTVSEAPVTVLRSAADGSLLMTLEKADISSLEKEGWKAPEVFAAPGRDGKTEMWGLICLPTNFNPQKTYPVVEYIYSGPGDQYVPKTFSPINWAMSQLAELGFIVYQVDGMTTSFRSKAFEEVCYKNLKDAGLPDHIAWLKAAAEKYPQIDTSRVGIFGCSAGGQEAMGAVLFHPEVYKAAYAACGCHDNRMDKIWWNEQWMGYPVDSSYIENSNIENAYRLTRPLMLVWGELDDNVDPSSTMKVVAALQKAGKDFDMLVIAGAHHTMGENWGEHKRYDFFVNHLMGVRPPSWNETLTR